MLASAATTMTAVAFGAMMAVGMRGCAADSRKDVPARERTRGADGAQSAAAGSEEEGREGGSVAVGALRDELAAETLAGLCTRAAAAGVSSADSRP